MIIWPQELDQQKILLEPWQGGISNNICPFIQVLSHFSRCLGNLWLIHAKLSKPLHSTAGKKQNTCASNNIYDGLLEIFVFCWWEITLQKINSCTNLKLKSPIWRILPTFNYVFEAGMGGFPKNLWQITLPHSIGSVAIRRFFRPSAISGASFAPWRLQILLVRFGALQCLSRPRGSSTSTFFSQRFLVLVLWVFCCYLREKIMKRVQGCFLSRVDWSWSKKIQNTWYETARVLLFINGYSRKVSSIRITHNLKLVQVQLPLKCPEYATPSTRFGSWGNLFSKNTRFSEKLDRTINS